jgi:hypothetical protein
MGLEAENPSGKRGTGQAETRSLGALTMNKEIKPVND